MPETASAFLNASRRESFWFSLDPRRVADMIEKKAQLLPFVSLGLKELLDLAGLCCRIIDFRSRFTATHSSGVAATAAALATHFGMSGQECLMMEIAGYLHDLGKLAVPLEILEKEDTLTKEEFNVIKCHTYYSYHLMDRIPQFGQIRDWAAFHHERLDGRGYPFGHSSERLPIGARIMSVADVFTAVTEDRPFRKAMKLGPAMQVIDRMVDSKALDGRIVAVLKSRLEEFNRIRDKAQSQAAEKYQRFGQHNQPDLSAMMNNYKNRNEEFFPA